MRQIEKQMVEAVKEREPFISGNTEVTEYEGGSQGVYLHGNLIASVVDYEVYPYIPTLIKWPTRTTMSRLRALGVDVCTRRGDIYLDGEKLA